MPSPAPGLFEIEPEVESPASEQAFEIPHRPGDETGWRLSREQVLDQILELNPSAGRGFLEQFEGERLGAYLDRLLAARSPRGADARWSRRGETPAVMVRRRRGT